MIRIKGERSSDDPPRRTGGTTRLIGANIGSTNRLRNSYAFLIGWPNDTLPNTTMYDNTIHTMSPRTTS